MPSPVVVGRAIWKLATTEYGHVLITLGRLLGAMLFSAVAGILLGLVMGVSATMRPFIRALVVIDTGIPALSWILLAVFWFKNPETRIFFILTLILLPFYALNIYDGIRKITLTCAREFGNGERRSLVQKAVYHQIFARHGFLPGFIDATRANKSLIIRE